VDKCIDLPGAASACSVQVENGSQSHFSGLAYMRAMVTAINSFMLHDIPARPQPPP